MSLKRSVSVWILLCVQGCAIAAGQGVTSPETHLGRPVGTDFELADWEADLQLLPASSAKRARTPSPSKAGTTTEGRDFLITVISSPENLANLDRIKAASRTLADPRGRSEAETRRAIEDGRVDRLRLVRDALHRGSRRRVRHRVRAHALATSDEEPWKSARDEVVAVVYTTNPDGLDHVVESRRTPSP